MAVIIDGKQLAKKIRGELKEINNINIQMIKFSLLGETILEWNDKDIDDNAHGVVRGKHSRRLCKTKNYRLVGRSKPRPYSAHFQHNTSQKTPSEKAAYANKELCYAIVCWRPQQL